MRGMIGKKIGMTQIYSSDGILYPVTVIEAGPCVVTQVKTELNDGYEAVQIGFGKRKEKNTSKPLKGHFSKAGVEPLRVLAEFEKISGFEYEPGQVFGASIFSEGDIVTVTGTTKGHGFSGVMKRHGFKGGPATHGQREYDRSPGSIGQASDPSRVFKGMRMAGQYGNQRQTIQNLKIVQVNKENNQLLVKGAVPGANNGIVFVTK